MTDYMDYIVYPKNTCGGYYYKLVYAPAWLTLGIVREVEDGWQIEGSKALYRNHREALERLVYQHEVQQQPVAA